MAAEIINLKEFRKKQARRDKERQAAENRTRFGRTKVEKQTEAAEKQRRDTELDGKKRDPDA